MSTSSRQHRSRSMSFVSENADFFSAREVIVVMKQNMSEDMFQSSSMSCSSFQADFGTDTFGDFGDFAEFVDTPQPTPTFLPSHPIKTAMRRSSCTGRVQTSDVADGWQEPHPTKPETKTRKKKDREKPTGTTTSQRKDHLIKTTRDTTSRDTMTKPQNSCCNLPLSVDHDDDEQEFFVTSHSSLAERKKLQDQLLPHQKMPRRSSCGPGYSAENKDNDQALSCILKSSLKVQCPKISQDQQLPYNISNYSATKENTTSQSRLGRHFSSENGPSHCTLSKQRNKDDASVGTAPTVSSFTSGSLSSSTRSRGRQQQRRMSCPGKSEIDMQLSMATVKIISASSGIQW